METNRRDFIRTAAVLSLGSVLTQSKAAQLLSTDAQAFELPPLGYSYDALEPYIDAQTMQLHHDKHHQAYVTKLNKALEKEPYIRAMKLDELMRGSATLPEPVRQAVINNGGGHWNHSFFWPLLKKDTAPGPKLSAAINKDFGSMESFRREFEKTATAVFGSGWAWLVLHNGKLSIGSTPNQENPLMPGARTQGKPVIGLDVWEHAYYLKYQNRRPEYLQGFWSVLNWEQAEKNFIS